MTKPETPVTNNETTIAIMSNDIGYIKSDIKDIKISIEKLSGVFASKAEMVEVNKIQVDHENRIRTGEQSMWKYLGASAVITIIVSIVLPLILKLFIK